MRRFVCCVLLLALFLSLCAEFSIQVHAQPMTASDQFVAVLKVIEAGVSPEFPMYPYWDYSQYSIGYGTKCPDDKLDYYRVHGITEEEATQLLYAVLPAYEEPVNRFAQEHGLALTQNQFDALLSFTYNCGSSWIYETDGYFNRAVREGMTGSDFLYGICLWSSAGGDYILTKRRMSEANMYLNGVYEAYNDDSDGTYPANYKYVFLDGNGGTSRYTIHGYDAGDPIGITTDFSAVPQLNGEPYEFAGWFTERVGGELIEILDGTLPDGTVLYAQWKNADGEIVPLPKGDPCTPTEVSVTDTVNVRSGPGTFFKVLGKLHDGDTVTIRQTYTQGSTVWGEFDGGWLSLSYTNYFEVIWPRTGKVNGTDVNVRSGPGTSNPVQYQLNTGDAVTIHAREYGSGLYWGRLSDGNWICLDYVVLDVIPPKEDEDDPIPDTEGKFGDIDADGELTKDDAIYLLRYVVFPDKYPISADGDITKDREINKDDAIYLLRHVVFPDKYPLPVD